MRVVDAEALENDPRIKAKMHREVAALARTHRKPDLSDARELPAPAWESPLRGMDTWLEAARAGRFYKPVKQAVSMRLDTDVVAWLKRAGPGYQTRANQILREKMLEER